jgi:hypothetical protein
VSSPESFGFRQDTIKELSQKLEDSNKLLASNQQGTLLRLGPRRLLSNGLLLLVLFVVITWLNKEINEAQLGHQRRSSAHPSVLAFHPSDKVQ